MKAVGTYLKPCPFCGGTAVMMDFLCASGNPLARETRYIGCRGERCCVVSFAEVTRDEVIAKWNSHAGQRTRE